MEDTPVASASATREAREARARLYGATVSYADKANLASSLAERLERGGGVAGVDDGASATQTAALLVEWSLAVLAWAGLAARASGGGGKGSKSKNGGAGSGAGAGAGGAPARPPRAVGANAPSPASACADPAPWRALIAGLADGDRRAPNARHAPAPTAAAHLIHAAAAAASANRASASKPKPAAGPKTPTVSSKDFGVDPIVHPSVVAAALARLRGRLGAQFRPAAEHCLAAAAAALRADPKSPLARETLRATARSVRASPHRAPPAPDAETLDAILLAAAAEVRGDVMCAYSARASNRVPEDDPASSALRAALMHPSHLAGVPRAFADAAPVDPRGSAKRRKVPGAEAEGAEAEGAEAEGAEGVGAGVASAPSAKSENATREPARTPEFVRVVARRIISSARARGDVAALAPWTLRAFVEETRAIAAASATGGAGTSARGKSADDAARVGGGLLFDALFAPTSESSGDRTAFHPRAKKRGRGGVSTRDRSCGIDRESNPGRSDVSVAPALVRELRVAGLYSLAAVGGGPAPSADRPPVRDRLTAYAERVYAPENIQSARWTEVVAATEALLDVDARLVEPHAAAAVAATWRAKGGALEGDGAMDADADAMDADADAMDAYADAECSDTDHASIASRCFAKMLDAYASTRRLPEFLDALGDAATTTIPDAPTKAETRPSARASSFARTPGSPAAIDAATRAASGIPSGQLAAAVSSAREATSRCLAALSENSFAGVGKSLAAERATASASLVASILAALPAVPGEALPGNAETELRDFAREIRERLRAWFEKRRTGSKNGESSRDVDAAIAGSSLACVVPVAAILEVCHDRQELHGEHARAYLGEDGPSLAETCALALEDATRCESAAVARAVGRAVAGAAMHRVAQVARVAKPPPAGVSDAIAEKEARTLVALVARGERSEAKDTTPAERAVRDAVAELTRECADVWTPWADEKASSRWAREGGDAVFQTARTSRLWAREIGDALAAAAATLAKEACEKGAKRTLADAAVATAKAASRGDFEKTAKSAAAFWKLAADASAGSGNDATNDGDSAAAKRRSPPPIASRRFRTRARRAWTSRDSPPPSPRPIVRREPRTRRASPPPRDAPPRNSRARIRTPQNVYASFVATFAKAATVETQHASAGGGG